MKNDKKKGAKASFFLNLKINGANLKFRGGLHKARMRVQLTYSLVGKK